MTESQEQLKPQTESIFFDWFPYQGEELKQSLSDLGIEYTEPKINQDLRDRIESYLNTRVLSDNEITALKICLRFLERGMMIDGFKSNEKKRHEFLLANKVKIGEEEITLYELSKRVSKLSVNKISLVITAGELIGDTDIRKRTSKLKEKIQEIKKEPGYFTPDNVKEVDSLATDIINFILES